MNDAGIHAQARLQDIRLRILNREDPTPAEMRDLLLDVMQGRASSAAAAAANTRKERAAKTKAEQPPLDLEGMFNEQHSN